MDIHSDFELKQKVKILPFNMEGHIEGVYYSFYGVKYYVTFSTTNQTHRAAISGEKNLRQSNKV